MNTTINSTGSGSTGISDGSAIQLGASLDNVGRNKAEVVAEVVAEQAFELTRDVNIEVYPQGITPQTAESFMDGCDYVMDQMEFWQVKNRYALHRAFRASSRCRFMFKIPTVGHKVFVWFADMQRMPIFGACPPLAEGILAERLAQEIMDIPGRTPLPVWWAA